MSYLVGFVATIFKIKLGVKIGKKTIKLRRGEGMRKYTKGKKQAGRINMTGKTYSKKTVQAELNGERTDENR